MKECAFCKAENADEAKFCVICGKDLSKKPVMKYVVGWFLVVAVVIGGIILKEKVNVELNGDIQVVSWRYSGETMYLDIYNGRARRVDKARLFAPSSTEPQK